MTYYRGVSLPFSARGGGEEGNQVSLVKLMIGKLSIRWFSHMGKIILTADQFVQCLACNETFKYQWDRVWIHPGFHHTEIQKSVTDRFFKMAQNAGKGILRS